MVGKWHLCPDDEMNLASTRRNWPTGRGFERWYGFLGAETNQWYPDLVYDNHTVDQPKTPEEGYHLTVDLTDKAIEFIRDAKAIAPEKPFFLYYAPGACHAPHHAPKAWIDKYKGRFDMGYEAHARARRWPGRRRWASSRPTPSCRRSTRSARPRPAPGPTASRSRRWTSRGRGTRCPPTRRRLFARMAEVYAGFLGHADTEIGRLLGFLEEFGWRENTLVIVVSDNGASGEGGPNGSVNEMKFANGIPDTIEANLPLLDELGSPTTYNHYPNGWAMAFNTPFKMWKRYEFNGGTSDPCIISWPAGIDGPRRDPRAVPPCDRPRADDPRRARRRGAAGRSRATPRAASTASACATASTTRRRRRRGRTQFYSMLGSRGIWHDGWKAVTNHPTLSGWSHFNDDEWELYHIDVDRSELHNLAAEHPEKVRELVNLWFAEAGANGAFPLDDRSALEIMLTPRPVLSPPRNRYIYFPDAADVPESQAVNVRNRSYTIGALVDIPAPGAQGVLFAHGSLFGGHALYVKDNRLHYVYNFVGMDGAARRRDRRRPDRREPDPVGVVRQGRRGSAGRRQRACSRSGTATTRSARGASRPSPASS